jgi:hypothetical protein
MVDIIELCRLRVLEGLVYPVAVMMLGIIWAPETEEQRGSCGCNS